MGGIRNLQVCARCRNHSKKVILKGHKKYCPHKFCACDKCLVTKDRQSFIAKEIAMHRYEIKSKSESDINCQQGLKLNLVRSKSMEEKSTRNSEFKALKTPKKSLKFQRHCSEVRKDQLCSRCRNHNVDQLLRGHKNACPFANCPCEKCEITMKRREIMARQIKDYRSLKASDESMSSPDVDSPDNVPDFKELRIESQDPLEPFVDYEPVENRDLFFMIQSLYERYGNQNSYNKVQLIHAFAHLAKGSWDVIDKALDRGKYCRVISFLKFKAVSFEIQSL